MARKPLLECSFLVPVRRDRNLSDGQPHGRKAWKWLETSLCEFGGASRATGLYEGWYVDPDTKEPVTDQSRRYVVAVARAKLGRLRALLGEACEVFQQKCIYLSVAGQVEFVKPEYHEPEVR